MTTQSNQPDDRASRMKFWGAAVILLMMVLMVFSTNVASQFTRNRGGAGGIVIGTASNGRKVTNNERVGALNLLDSLDSIYVVVPGLPSPQQLGISCWGEAVMRDFKSHPEALALLLQESIANGPGASPSALGSLDPTQRSADALGLMNSGMISTGDLHPLPGTLLNRLTMFYGDSPVQIVIPRFDQRRPDGTIPQNAPADLPPQQQERIYGAIAQFLTIQSAASLLDGAAKVSQPTVDRLVAENRQQYSLQVATYDANPRFNATTQPTDAQLQQQLTTYAANPPGNVTRENPFGFGYRVPDRVKLEMISYKRADVAAIVRASKTDYDWEVAARMNLARDRVAFTSHLPESHPARVAATQPAATQPAFDTYKAEAIQIEIDAAVDERCAEVERFIRSTTSGDYQTWSVAQAQHAAAMPVSSLKDVPYNDETYFNRLAAKVQENFHILPSVARYDEKFRDVTELGAVGAFGRAFWTAPQAVAEKLRMPDDQVDAPHYAIAFSRALMAPLMLQNTGEAVLDVYEPSDPVATQGADRETFIFRITQAQPNHPATVADDLDNLHQRLTIDWRANEAQQQTLADAQAAAKNAQPNADLQIPGAAVATVVVGPFGGRDAATPPPALMLDQNGYIQFTQQVNEKLIGDPMGTPVAVLNVPVARKVYVARRTAMRGTWSSTEELDQLRSAARMRIEQDLSRIVQPTDEAVPSPWFSAKRILERNSYQAVKND